MSRLDETIVAIASPQGGAARGIVRISGPGVISCLEGIFHADGPKKLSDIRRPTALSGRLQIGELASPLSCELYLWPNERSYTGEPVAELHTIGCQPLLDLLVGSICARGCRLAQPGEFTLRAFLSGRIDLTQAEAVLGLIDAHDQRQLDVALEQLAGGLARPLSKLRDMLIDLLSHLEAGFDFADEDLPFITPEQLRSQLNQAAAITADLARQIKTRTTSSEIPSVVLMGLPNAGKSSLFNALVAFVDPQTQERDSHSTPAIVSHHAGTTRDYVTARLDLDGVVCRLVDTAGVVQDDKFADETNQDSPVESESQVIAQSEARKAQVRLLCIDATRQPTDWEQSQTTLCHGGMQDDRGQSRQLIVITKIDAAGSTQHVFNLTQGAITTSSSTGEGIAELRQQLRTAVLLAVADASAVVAPTALRCRQSVRLAAESLSRAREIADVQNADSVATAGPIPGEELIAAELHVALDELGKVVGTIYTDDVLDRIFSRFCVGK